MVYPWFYVKKVFFGLMQRGYSETLKKLKGKRMEV